MSNWSEAIRRPVQALHLDGLGEQVLALALSAALLPALVSILVIARQGGGSREEEVGRALRDAGAVGAWEASRWLDDRLEDLRAAVTLYAVSDNLARLGGRGAAEATGRLRDYVGSVRQRMTDCEALVLLDARGHVVAASGSRMSGVQFSLDRLNTLRMGDALVGDAYWDSGIGKAALTLAVPVRQADGRLVGSLTAKVNLHEVADILQRLVPEENEARGDAYVMTDQGRLILESGASSADVMRTTLPSATIQPLVDAAGTAVASQGVDGKSVLAALRRIPALRWAVVVELPRAQALRRPGRIGGGTIFFLFLLVAAAAGVAALLSLLIVRPVRRLAAVAAQVAAGDLTVEIPGGAGGEVGRVTQVFKNLLTRVRDREGQGELERLSVTDALTGLYNRRHLMGTLGNEVQRSRRLRRTFSVVLADVDHFKQYNDANGHLAGDAALVKIAEILRKTTRGVDSVARYGGEEFVVMLIEAPMTTALTVAERIRARVAAESFQGGNVTVSLGVAEYPTHGDTPEELIASADAAMYDAKRGGRDRVIAAGVRTAPDPGNEGRRRRKSES